MTDILVSLLSMRDFGIRPIQSVADEPQLHFAAVSVRDKSIKLK
jgi:hypothetical protein